ncbi:MAG: hypothetical protein ABI972_18365 [Acidobacteriota bacterium]
MKFERLSDGVIELDITTDFGPRVIRYGFVGGQNLMLTLPAELDTSGEPDFKCRGGHRLWVAPEMMPGTYYPDNVSVDVKRIEGGIIATAPVESVGLQKQLILELRGKGQVRITHRLWNRGGWPIEVSIWALTMMAPGGLGIAGFPPRGMHPEMLAPTNPLIMWAFSDFTDERLKITKKYLTLRQQPSIATPNKFGLWSRDTWGAYLLGGDLFVKRTQADIDWKYPDFGASFEMWVNGGTLELETLSPLRTLVQGDSMMHYEDWSLHHVSPLDEAGDDAIDGMLGTLGLTV